MSIHLRLCFTLVELLVVIAIISILAAMLLPTLQQATLDANVIYCTNNHKNMAMGLFLYADEFNDQLPTHRGRTPFSSDGVTVDVTWNSGGGSYASSYWMWYMIKNYNYNKSLFVCPVNPHNNDRDGLVDSGREWFPGIGRDGDGFANGYTIDAGRNWYGFNGRLLRKLEFWDTNGTRVSCNGRRSACDTPSRTILTLEYFCAVVMNDGNTTLKAVITGIGPDPKRWRDHSASGSVFTAVDGHAEKIQYPSNPNQLTFISKQAAVSATDSYFKPLWQF